MAVKNLVEEIAAVMTGQLGVPDHPLDLPDSDGLDGISAIVNAEARFEVNRVLGDLAANQKNDFFILQQRLHIEALEVGAERAPIGIVEINVVFPAHPLAFAHIIHQVLQFILRVHIRRQNGGVQILEEIAADDLPPEIYVIAKAPLLCIEGRIAVIVIGIEADWELFKSRKILPEQIGVLPQQLAVLGVRGPKHFNIGLVEGFGDNGQTILLEVPLVVKPQENGVGKPVVSSGLQDIGRRLHVLGRVLSVVFVESQAVGGLRLLDAVQLRHAAGNFDCGHKQESFP